MSTPCAAAVTAAATADATVLVMGIDTTIEAEMLDRYNITLPGLQNDLIASVAGWVCACAALPPCVACMACGLCVCTAASAGPVIVVIMTGGPLDVSVPKNHTGVNGMIWCGYPGQSGGQAIADVIFGTYPPGARACVVCRPVPGCESMCV